MSGVVDSDPVQEVLSVLGVIGVGVGAGILSALLGVGGAVITTPAIRLLGASPIEAVGSTVPAILPGALSGTLRYARAGLVDWRAALGLGLSGSAFALTGALASSIIDGRILMVLTAVLMLWSGFSVVRGARRQAHDPAGRALVAASSPATAIGGSSVDDLGDLLGGVESSETDMALAGQSGGAADVAARPRHPIGVLVGVGAVSGFVAGLLGVGGGIVMVPMLTGPLRTPMKTAVASSLVAVAIFSVPALVAHSALGHIDWSFALPLMAGVVPGARIGAHLTIGASDRTIRLAFGALIVALAVIYGVSEASALI